MGVLFVPMFAPGHFSVRC